MEPHDFGSILRFIQSIFDLGEGSLGFADARATGDLRGFFEFKQKPRRFQTIMAPLDANFFINDTRKPDPPDDDDDDNDNQQDQMRSRDFLDAPGNDNSQGNGNGQERPN